MAIPERFGFLSTWRVHCNDPETLKCLGMLDGPYASGTQLVVMQPFVEVIYGDKSYIWPAVGENRNDKHDKRRPSIGR